MAGAMPILAFDTAQGACSAAISHGGRLLSRRFETMRRGHAERLLPMIEAVRRQAGIAFADLDLIAVTVGPGTFTGVRVGLAAARALALVHDIPILGIGTLELLARAAVRAAGGGIIAAIDARRGEIYSQAFDGAGHALTAAAAGPAGAHVAPPGLTPGLIVGSGAELLRADLPNWRVENSLVQPDAAILARAGEMWRHRAGRRPPAPLYLRAPAAKLPEPRRARALKPARE